ncbi:hypothetical protein D3C78_1402780 [compost metagenome]
MVGQLGQGLGPGDADADRNAGALPDLGANPPAQRLERAGHAAQLGEGLVDAVDLQLRHQALDHRHHPLAHVAVQRIVRGEGADAVAPQGGADLEVGLAHLHEWLGVRTAGDHATIVVAQHHDRRARQVRAEDPLAAGVERIAVDQREDRLSHGHAAGCWR